MRKGTLHTPSKRNCNQTENKGLISRVSEGPFIGKNSFDDREDRVRVAIASGRALKQDVFVPEETTAIASRIIVGHCGTPAAKGTVIEGFQCWMAFFFHRACAFVPDEHPVRTDLRSFTDGGPVDCPASGL